jgi:hypothetical protein
MVVPRAVRAAFALFELFLGQGVVGGVLAVPGDPTARPSSQSRIGSRHYVSVIRRDVALDASVSPCQFAPLIVLVHQFQESFSRISSDEPLPDRFGSADVSELVHTKLSSPLLRVSFQGLDFTEAESQFALVGF